MKQQPSCPSPLAAPLILPRALTTRGVCVYACVLVCIWVVPLLGCECEFSCNVRLGMCMFKLPQSDESETSEQRECLFLGKLDMVEKKKVAHDLEFG